MSLLNSILSVFRRITIVIAIASTFLFGLATTVYLSLLSPEVTVPNVLGQDRFEAEKTLGEAGLNFRVRATRPSNQVKADTVLFQLPRAGEVVKAGQTVAMDISRATKEGESSQVLTAPAEEKKSETGNVNTNANENRLKRPKIANKNGNENSTTTTGTSANNNTNTNTSRSASANRARPTGDNSNTNENTGAVNRNEEVKNSNSNSGSNTNSRRPSPKPSPTVQNDNRDNR